MSFRQCDCAPALSKGGFLNLLLHAVRAARGYLRASLQRCRTCRGCGAPVELFDPVCNQCGTASPAEIPAVQCVCLTAILAEVLMLAIWVA